MHMIKFERQTDLSEEVATDCIRYNSSVHSYAIWSQYGQEEVYICYYSVYAGQSQIDLKLLVQVQFPIWKTIFEAFLYFPKKRPM